MVCRDVRAVAALVSQTPVSAIRSSIRWRPPSSSSTRCAPFMYSCRLRAARENREIGKRVTFGGDTLVNSRGPSRRTRSKIVFGGSTLPRENAFLSLPTRTKNYLRFDDSTARSVLWTPRSNSICAAGDFTESDLC